MKLNIIEDEPKSLVVELIDADRGIAEMIKDRLLDSKDVDFVTVMKDHPEVGKPRLVVKSSKNAKGLVLKALDALDEEIKEMTSQLPKK